MKKYLILDFGKVLAYPTTGDWFITPLFLKLVDMNKIKKEEILKVMNNYGDILSRKVVKLEEEYDLFYDFYKNVFNDLKYDISNNDISSLAYDFTYNDSKYGFYEGIDKELEFLSKKYILILLSDNWPCCFPIMRNRGIDKYFKKMYISSVYDTKKSEGVFFDYPINDFNILEGEAVFVDDNEDLLDVAVTKGLDVRLMDRKGVVSNSKYKIINNLEEFF